MRNIMFKNISGEAMPPYAVFMGVTPIEVSNRLVLQADKFDGTEGVVFYINGPIEIPDGRYGMASDERLNIVRYDTGSTPVMNQEWGPVSGEWFMSPDGTGYIVQSTETANQPNGTVLFSDVGGNTIAANCILIYLLSLRESESGSATLRAIFTEEGETPIVDSWVINFDDSLSDLTASFNALATPTANPGVFTLVRSGGDLPDGTVEFRVTATGWTVEFEWDAAGDELTGDHAAFLDRGYKSA